MKRLVFVICAILATGLAGCSSVSSTAGRFVESREGACPTVTILADAESVVRFSGPGRDLPDIHYQASVTDVSTTCRYGRSWGKRYVWSRVHINFNAELGSAAFPAPVSIPYFVALILPATEQVLTKEVYMLDVGFDMRPTHSLEDNIGRIAIPVQDTTEGGNYEIVIGFELTPDELQFNRRREY